MGQKIASLEIELAMATGQAVSDLAQFGGVVDKVSAQAIRDLDKIDAATKGIGDMSGPTAQMVQFADATAKSAIAAAREFNRIEKAGESLSAQLDRQINTFGKTSEELRRMKVETAALAAEQQGQAELAARLRQQEADLFALEFAQARAAQQAAEALAEERATAAAQAVQAAEREATAIREAAQAHQMFEARVRAGVAAMREESAAAAEFEAMIGRVATRVDPAATALARLKTELDEAKAAFDAGRISEGDFAQEQARVAAAAGNFYGPQRKLAGAIEEVGLAQRFTASETLNLSRQFQDIGVTAAMGMNPLMILAQQGPQIYDVLEQAKARGVVAAAAFAQMGKDILGYAVTGLGKLATFLTPVNILLAGTAMAVVTVVKSFGTYADALRQFETTAAGLGRVSGETAQQLESISEAAAVSGQRSIGATRDSVNAFAAAGIQGEQTLTSLASIVEKYAKLAGQEVPAAQAALAQAMRDPARAADTFTQQLGLLTGAQYEHIKQLAAQGDQEQATAELTRILTADIAANAHQVTGLAHYMDVLGSAVSGVTSWFGKLDQKIRSAGASYDAWLKQHAGGWAVDLFGTGNQAPLAPNPNAGRNQDQVAALNASQSLNTSGMRQFNDLLAQQRVLQKGLADTTGMTAVQIQALRHDYSAVTDTINANRDASGGWITTQERSHLIAIAQDKLAAAHTQREKAAAQQTISRLQLGTQVLTQQERQTQAVDAYNKVADKYVKPKVDHHAETLEREAEATEAQIKNLYKLADAYGVSGAAALIAEARVKAESQAIKQRGDIDAAVDRQVRLAIAQRVSDGDKATSGMRNQADAQERVNALVAAGLVPAARAGELVRDQLADLPLLDAIQAAQQRGLSEAAKAATKALEEQRAARERLTAATRDAQYLQDGISSGKQLAYLQEELRLIGATDAARVHALASLKATQEAEARGGTAQQQEEYIRQQVAVADAQQTNTTAQNNYNTALSYTADLLDAINQNAQRAGQGIADAFGSAGQAISGALTSVTGYYATQARLELAHNEAIKKAGADERAIARENSLYATRSAGAQIQMYGDIASAAKGLFKEHSAGYKAMETVEKAFRAVQLALSIQSMVQNVLETTGVVANAALKATAEGTAGVAKQSQLPFPANLVAMAATAAALVAAGVAIFGGIGGGHNNLPKANDGTGTVLGDASAQSASIKNAIDSLKSVDDVTLTVSRDMLISLRSIENNIGGLASLLVRTGNIDASADVTEGFKSNAIGSVLSKIPVIGGILGSLFGTKTKVVGSGLYGDSQSVGDILSGGFDASYYSDVQKKKKLFGVTTSTKYKTELTGADGEIEDQFTLLLRQFYETIGKAAGPLGQSLDTVQSKLLGFTVDIGKIDLQGLSGTEIQEKLEAVFGAAADDMARAGVPGLEKFQKVGEGYFETLVRVASTVEQVDATFQKLGRTTGTMGIDVDMAIAGLFDSVSDFTDAAQSYFESYYTEAEQAAAKAAQLDKVFASLGLAVPDTLAAYRNLVDAQDLTTAAGQQTYATLLQLAPAFADLKKSMDGAKSAADIMSERQDLERQLLELQGDTDAIRAAELAKLDVSNRALQSQIYAIQDAQAAAKAADELRQAWASVGDSIMAEVNRIRGMSDASGGGTFASLMGQFNAATSAARAGDQDAAKNLPQLSKSLLDAAALAATSRQELDRVQAQTAASLEATYAAIGGLTGIAPATTTSTADALAALSASQAATGTTAANDDLLGEVRSMRQELASLRDDNNRGNAAIVAPITRVARTLDNVTAGSGGDAISTVAVAAA